MVDSVETYKTRLKDNRKVVDLIDTKQSESKDRYVAVCLLFIYQYLPHQTI